MTRPRATSAAAWTGLLLGAVRAGSELAIDAFVVAVGDLVGGALVVTTDERDMSRLAAHTVGVAVAALDG